MFESIMRFFKNLSKKENKTANSKEAAKERLHLVLMQDRANVSADFLELMKQEIIEVIKKYIDIDEKAIDVRLTNKENEDGTNGAPALYANIPIINIKNDARKIDAKENTKNQIKETKKEEQKESKKTEKVEDKHTPVKEERIEKKQEQRKQEEIKQESKQESKQENKQENKQEENKKEDMKKVDNTNKNKDNELKKAENFNKKAENENNESKAKEEIKSEN